MRGGASRVSGDGIKPRTFNPRFAHDKNPAALKRAIPGPSPLDCRAATIKIHGI
jgi:hypothetical protein